MMRFYACCLPIVAAFTALCLVTAAPFAQQRQEQLPAPGNPSQGQQQTPRSEPKAAPQPKSTDPKAGQPKVEDQRAGDPKAAPQRKASPGGPRGPAPAPKALPAEKYVSPIERDRLLADLYALLATAADEKAAGQHASAIERLWQTATSETAIVLIERAGVALAGKDNALALDLLNEAVRLGPDQTETWGRRAFFHMADNNVHAAIGDLRRVIALEPNHFRALATLANLLKEVQEKPAALKLARQVKEIHPFFDGMQAIIDELSRAVDGEGT